jgi:hypothetical protein
MAYKEVFGLHEMTEEEAEIESKKKNRAWSTLYVEESNPAVLKLLTKSSKVTAGNLIIAGVVGILVVGIGIYVIKRRRK